MIALQYHDRVFAPDLVEGPDLLVEGHRSGEVGHGDQGGAKGPGLCLVVRGMVFPPLVRGVSTPARGSPSLSG